MKCTIIYMYFRLEVLHLCNITYNLYVYFNSIHFASRTYFISSIRINRRTTRCRWKFRICTTTNDHTLYSFSSLYIFVTWGWPTVAETRRQPNKIDKKTVVFDVPYPLLKKWYVTFAFRNTCHLRMARGMKWSAHVRLLEPSIFFKVRWGSVVL